MKGLETGKEKVKKICDILRKETLEPAKLEAEEILESAKKEKEAILAQAYAEKERLILETKKEIERQHTIFQASLGQACRQTLEDLREKIEKRLFSKELSHLLSHPLKDKKVIAQLIESVIKALDKEGIESDLSAYIASAVPAKEVNELLVSEILERLKEKSVLVSSIGGGVEIKIQDKNLILDFSDQALKELVANYIRKDFREFIFAN